MLDIISDHSLTQIVDKPTRKDKTLDLILTNYPDIIENTETIPPLGEADHDIILFQISVSLHRPKTTPNIIFKYSKANWSNIKEDLHSTYLSIVKSQHTDHVNDLWNKFKNDLQDTTTRNIPTKTIKNKNKLPWITKELKRKMNTYKKKLLSVKKRNLNKSDNLRKLKSEIQNQQRKAYWSYIENMIFDIPIPEQGTNLQNKTPKNLFSYIKTQKTDSKTIPPLRTDGILKSDAISKANILNKQFQTAFTPDNNDNIPNKGPSPYQPITNIHITTNGIYKLLSNLKPHKAAGPDKIKTEVLKECNDPIAQILTIIFQKSLSTGTIPKDWKHAIVCPAYKKGDKHNPINYRPISLTCICCKIIEHIVSSNIMKHLELNNILYDLQHGFRPARSCETQLVSFLHELSKSNDERIQTDIIIMDFAKAFDKVPHRHLLYKLEYYGITGTTLDWIRTFLTDRTQTVALEGVESNKVPVTSGVPQGTVLGPILFLIYINDFPEYIKHSKLRLFADDSIIYNNIKNTKDAQNLQLDLDAACKWESDWLMKFHPDKCNVLSVTQKRKPIQYNYTLRGHPLLKVKNAKYLGITIQDNLKFDKHINNITNKANQTLGFLKRNLKIQSSKVKEHAYKALVRPKLEYSSTVWDPHTKSQINQIEKVQRRAARFVSNRYNNTSSVTNMLEKLNWPSLEIRRTRSRLIMFYKIIHQVVAISPPPHLLVTSDQRTRFNNPYTFKQIQTDKDTYKFSFYPRIVTQWNLLPIQAHEAATVDAFKSMIPVSVLIPIYHH